MTSKFLFFLFVFLFFQGCSFNLLEVKNPTVPDGTPPPPPILTSCPTNFVPVPSKNSDSSILFCVAKYEMKNVDGKAVSQAPGSPWINNIIVAKDNRGLSHGHSDGEPSNSLEASSDDNEVCFGTRETCSQSEWSDHFAGNVWEWISDKEITPELFTEADNSISIFEQGAFIHGGCLASGQSADIMTIYRPVGSSTDIQLPDEHGDLIGFRCVYGL